MKITELKNKFRIRYDQFTKSNIEHAIKLRPYLHGLPYWTAAAIVGVVAVLYSNTFSQSIHFAQSVFAQNPKYLFVLSPVCFFLSVWLVERYAPTAGGTGVSQVTKVLSLDPATEGSTIDTYLNLKVAMVVAASSLLCVLGAGGLGREGPMIHMAACIFYFTGKQFQGIWKYEEHRSWIIAGGAAGIAAAFNAPLAGVVFVLEELSQLHFHKFKNVVLAAAIIAGAVAQWLSGRYLYFGFPEIPHVPFSSIFWAIAVGVTCALVSIPFHKMLSIDWRSRAPKYFKSRLKFSLLIGLCVAAIANFISSDSIGGGIQLIEKLLFNNEHASWAAIAGRFLATSVSHLSGVAGGFLAPSLALGAAIGSKFSELTNYSQHNLLVLCGMSAFLSAITRAPFTAWVIVMEMTNKHSAIFPLMVSSLISYMIVRRIVDHVKPNE